MTMQLSADHLQTLVAKTILDSLTPEKRDELFATAISSLLATRYSSYSGRTESPLGKLFADAMEQAARKVVTEQLAQPEARAKLDAIVKAALDKALNAESYEGGRDGLLDKLAKGIAHAFNYEGAR
jgi:hypothetical protein